MWFENDISDILKDETYLFCDSDFLVQKDPSTDEALDIQGHGITVDGHLITISEVAVYAEELRDGNVPWWAGERSEIYGYYFAPEDSGGNYCNSNNLGLTAVVTVLEQTPVGGQPTPKQIQDVILCPSAFGGKAPGSYREASATITEGSSLEVAVPKSATLLHKGFHVVHGANFLEGESEVCRSSCRF
jgi:hypothetical protein